jgi:hypothetical protein
MSPRVPPSILESLPSLLLGEADMGEVYLRGAVSVVPGGISIDWQVCPYCVVRVLELDARPCPNTLGHCRPLSPDEVARYLARRGR